MVTTPNGEMPLAQVKTKCEELRGRVEKIAVSGCGTRLLDLESISLGGGHFSAPNIKPRKPYYAIGSCSQIPKPSDTPPSMRALIPRVAQVCKLAPVVAINEWTTSALRGGGAVRRTVAECWISGKRDDWGKEL